MDEKNGLFLAPRVENNDLRASVLNPDAVLDFSAPNKRGQSVSLCTQDGHGSQENQGEQTEIWAALGLCLADQGDVLGWRRQQSDPKRVKTGCKPAGTIGAACRARETGALLLPAAEYNKTFLF